MPGPRLGLGDESSSRRPPSQTLFISKIITLLALRYKPLHRSTTTLSLIQRQRHLFTAKVMPFELPAVPNVPGADPSRAVLHAFKVAIARRVAGALPPLTIQQVYQGIDYGKKGVDFTIALPRFRLPGKVDVLAKTVIDQVCVQPTGISRSFLTIVILLLVVIARSSRRTIS